MTRNWTRMIISRFYNSKHNLRRDNVIRSLVGIVYILAFQIFEWYTSWITIWICAVTRIAWTHSWWSICMKTECQDWNFAFCARKSLTVAASMLNMIRNWTRMIILRCNNSKQNLRRDNIQITGRNCLYCCQIPMPKKVISWRSFHK